MKTHNYPTMQPCEARLAGFVSMTRPYRLYSPDEELAERETRWWDNITRDFTGCKCVVVMLPDGPEMWRHNSELDLDHTTGVKLRLTGNATT